MERRYKVKLNSSDKIEDLLQEIYDQSCRHFNEIQAEINKLANSTNLGAEGTSMEEKTKYAKAMHDFLIDKKNAIAMKLEVAKFMGEVMKHSGNVDAALSDKSFQKRTTLDLEGLRAQLNKGGDGETNSYIIK